MEDNATVPLFYEKRVPKVLIQNDDLGDEFYELLEDEDLDDAQQEKLEKKYARELEVIVFTKGQSLQSLPLGTRARTAL